MIWYFVGYYLISGIVWGIAAQAIAENKGYTESHWFWLGFALEFIGIIIVVTKPENKTSEYVEQKAAEIRRQDAVNSGAWTCKKCGKFNYAYMTTCTCGMAKSENDSYKPILGAVVTEEKPADAPDQIKKLKELLDIGAITQEEFDSKKAELLK